MPRAVLVLLLLATPASAAVFPEPYSWEKPVGDRWVFVQLGDPAKEAVAPSADARRQFTELRAKYPATGLYPRDGTTPVWTVEGYAPIEHVFPSADGVHLVRIEGSAWIEVSFPNVSRRLAPEVEAEQLDSLALTFFENGKPLVRYTLRDLIVEPRKLPHSPRYVLWTAGSALNDNTNRYVQFTQDGQMNVFDVRTGQRLEKVARGLANPLARWLLTSASLASLTLALVWVWWVFRRSNSPSRQSSPAQPAP